MPEAQEIFVQGFTTDSHTASSGARMFYACCSNPFATVTVSPTTPCPLMETSAFQESAISTGG